MRILYLTILLIFISALQSISQEDLISKAKEEYSNGNYNKSIEYYNKLLSGNYYSLSLYYNLGNAYYKTNDLGKAILYYEKALKFSPNDSDIKHNIFLTKRKIDSEIIELPDFFLKRWWVNFTNIFGLGMWTFISLFLALLLVLVFGLFWFRNYNFKGNFPILISFILLLFIISIFSSFRLKHVIYNNDFNILIKSDSLFTAPDNRSELMYNLSPGEKLQLLDSLDRWYKIKLVNKETGWINKSNCKKI